MLKKNTEGKKCRQIKIPKEKYRKKNIETKKTEKNVEWWKCLKKKCRKVRRCRKQTIDCWIVFYWYLSLPYDILGDKFSKSPKKRIQRSHPNIWSFVKCLQREKTRIWHILIQMNAGAQSRPKMAATTVIEQVICTLNERYRNNAIDLRELS